MEAVYLERDEGKRQALLKDMTREILDKAPYVWLPTPHIFTAWWPWVKNYGGELRAGAVRPGPIYARIWIDQDLKKTMGHWGSAVTRPLLERNHLTPRFYTERAGVTPADAVSFHVDPGETLPIAVETQPS